MQQPIKQRATADTCKVRSPKSCDHHASSRSMGHVITLFQNGGKETSITVEKTSTV